MNAEVLDVPVGARLWCEGAAWTVVELDGTTAVLRSGDRIRRFHTPSLVGHARPLEEPTDQRDPHTEVDAVVLASLTTAQRTKAKAEARVLDEVVLAASQVPLEQRYQRAGQQAGDLRAHGPPAHDRLRRAGPRRPRPRPPAAAGTPLSHPGVGPCLPKGPRHRSPPRSWTVVTDH